MKLLRCQITTAFLYPLSLTFHLQIITINKWELTLLTSERRFLIAYKISEKGRNAGRAELMTLVLNASERVTPSKLVKFVISTRQSSDCCSAGVSPFVCILFFSVYFVQSA